MSDSLQPHRLQNARPHCPSPTPRVCSKSCPCSLWCHPTISSCHPLLLPPLIFPSISVFSNESVLYIRWPKYWSFSFSISPSFPLGLTDLISFLDMQCGIFWTVVLEKTLKSPLNCKEIQPVHPKRDQSWVFIGRTDAETETPILWPPHVKC